MSEPKLLDGRSRVFFTSDWHVGHASVLVFDQRPFKDLDHMHRVLVNNYLATVGPLDTCFFLGDMGLAKHDVLAAIVAQLHGTKVLILGNHDANATAMKRVGFDVVLNSASLIVGNQPVTMTHCPLRGVHREDVTGMRGADPADNWHGEHKHAQYSVPDYDQFHLHGHTHKPPAERTAGRQFDVGVRANDYRPVSRPAIESWIALTLKAEAS